VARTRINHFGAGRRVQVLAHGGDLVVLDQDVGPDAAICIDDRAATNE